MFKCDSHAIGNGHISHFPTKIIRLMRVYNQLVSVWQNVEGATYFLQILSHV